MANVEKVNKRLSNAARAAQAVRTPGFLSAEELEEIGILVIRFADIEEDIALYCEVLLLRPELGGFHSFEKLVITKHFSEKLTLFKLLVIASGVLYGIDTAPVEATITVLKDIGERRNTVIHGNLTPDEIGRPSFSRLGSNLLADIPRLRTLTQDCYDAHVQLISTAANFYGRLVANESTHSSIEESFQAVFSAKLMHLNSSHKYRNRVLDGRAANAKSS